MTSGADQKDGYGDDNVLFADEKAVVPTTSSSSSRSGLTSLNLTSTTPSYADAKDAVHLQEEKVLIVFDLPDGSQGESTFKLGQTVEYMKSFVECEYGINMQEQSMYLDDKLMLDPLSLLDYPEAKGVDELFIRVEGPLPAVKK